MLKELKDYDTYEYIGAGLTFLGILSPGFLVLWLFQPELIKELNSIKVILFSLSLSLPVYVINMVTVLALCDPEKSEGGIQSEHTFLAAALAFLASYPAILSSYLFDLRFSQFLVALAIAQTLVIAISILFAKIGTDANQ